MRICLSMIVKNEEHIIAECLDAVMPGVNEAIIHDTGSIDKTIECIDNFAATSFVAIKTESVGWVDFAHNRNLCLLDINDNSSSEYILLMDADDKPIVSDKRWRKQLGKFDVYNVEIRLNGVSYHRPMLLKNDRRFRFKGAVHEYLDIPAGMTVGTLQGVYIEASHKGARSSDPNKYAKDSFELLKELQREPNNARAQFYLAQSYNCLGDRGAALSTYKQRSQNETGWSEERWYSLYQIARITKYDGDYLACYSANRFRAEPLYHMAMQRDLRDPCALMFLAMAVAIQKPTIQSLFVENDVYDYLAKIAYATAAYWSGNVQTAREVNEGLLTQTDLPPEQRQRVQENLAFCIPKT